MGWIEVSKRKIILGGIYRHPKGKVQHFVDDMEATIKQLEPNITYVIIGDTNINLLDYENLHNATLGLQFHPQNNTAHKNQGHFRDVNR